MNEVCQDNKEQTLLQGKRKIIRYHKERASIAETAEKQKEN